MARIKKDKEKSVPAISTASLPDIVFMLLIFFMTVTVMRQGDKMVQVVVPNATQLTKLEEKSLVNQIFIGRPTERYHAVYGTRPRIQLGDRFADVNDIPLFLEQHRIKVPQEKKSRITTSLEVDKGVTMGIIGDVKTELRKANQLRLNYSVRYADIR